MSDTKQQCPHCGCAKSETRPCSCDCHDSAAAGSGAREQALNWLWHDTHLNSHMPIEKFGPYKAELNAYQVAEYLVRYADHCTAPLREQLDAVTKRDEQSFDNLRQQLTAERTRREAAERELKELRKLRACVHEWLTCPSPATWEAVYDAEAAALRGKEGSNG